MNKYELALVVNAESFDEARLCGRGQSEGVISTRFGSQLGEKHRRMGANVSLLEIQKMNGSLLFTSSVRSQFRLPRIDLKSA